MEDDLIENLLEEYPENVEDVEILVSLIDSVEDAAEEQRNVILADAQEKKEYLEQVKEVNVLDDVQSIINDLREEYEVDSSAGFGTTFVE